MNSSNTTPIVAIVGRPNVGKSTLFNRLAGQKRALVANTPGLTRDRIVEPIDVEGRRILMVDTAGLEPKANEELSTAIQAQARSAVAEADAILFVVDGQAGLLPEDEAIAQTLRRTDKPLLLAVNKIDVPKHADRVSEFHRLGFDSVRGISAEHGVGCFDCLDALVAALPESTEPLPDDDDDDAIRIAIVGRPNVGKSSTLNRLVGEDRVVVSETPGTTRDSIDIRIRVGERDFVLVDAAGLRRPGRRAERIERGSALMTVRSLERARTALLIVDASEGFTDQDAHIASMLREAGCSAVVLANKWDLVEPEAGKQLIEDIQHGLRFMSDAPILRVSAKTGARLGKLFPTVERVYDEANKQISTSDLNRWLTEAVERHEPSMARRGFSRRPLKFFYATQVAVHPPTFVLFCTDPRSILRSYRRYLENRLRESFGFDGTPIRLLLRSRTQQGKESKGGAGRASRR